VAPYIWSCSRTGAGRLEVGRQPRRTAFFKEVVGRLDIAMHLPLLARRQAPVANSMYRNPLNFSGFPSEARLTLRQARSTGRSYARSASGRESACR